MGPQLVDYLLYEKEDNGILWIKFNRPEKMNALFGLAACGFEASASRVAGGSVPSPR